MFVPRVANRSKFQKIHVLTATCPEVTIKHWQTPWCTRRSVMTWERGPFFCLWKQNGRLRGLQKLWACWREVLDVWKRTMLYMAAWSLLNQSRDVLGCWQVIWLSSSLPDRVHCSEPSSSSSSTKEPSAFQSHLLLSVTCSSIVYVVYKRNMNFRYFQFRTTHGTWDKHL